MLIRDLAQIVIDNGAPLLGALLGSPVSGLVLSLISSHLKLPTTYDIDSVANSIKQNQVMLKELEDKHREALVSMLSNLIQESETKTNPWIAGVVAIGCFMAMIGLLAWFILH